MTQPWCFSCCARAQWVDKKGYCDKCRKKPEARIADSLEQIVEALKYLAEVIEEK